MKNPEYNPYEFDGSKPYGKPQTAKVYNDQHYNPGKPGY